VNDARKPGVAFWSTVVVLLALCYPASFGPICWITSRTGGNSVLPVAYRPFTAMIPISDEPSLLLGLHGGTVFQYLKGLISAYATLGAKPGWAWRCSADWEPVEATYEFKRTTDWTWEWCDSSK